MSRAAQFTYALMGLAEALVSLAPRLEPREAARRPAEAMWRVLETLGASFEAEHFYQLTRAVGLLAPRLEARQAAEAVRQLLDAMAKVPNGGGAGTVVTLILPLDAGERRQRTLLTAAAVAGAATPPAFPTALVPLAAATRPLPSSFSEQQLVDFLKRPTCPRAVRRALLEQIGQQCGRPFADTREFVTWARKHRPDLDLTSPPLP